MSKLTTFDCKKAIVAWLTPERREELKKEFVGGGTEETRMIEQETIKENNWKRRGKAKTQYQTHQDVPVGSVERSFDCAPFDDQLRAYVYTDSADTKIIRIVVQGE